MRRLLSFASVLSVISLLTVPALAENRVALVIGNGAYQNAPRLANPSNDAGDVAAALKRSGFETILRFNLDKAGMEEATIQFSRAARRADVAVFYYSGHAMQYAGVNYLMPVDAKLSDEADLRRMARVDDIVVDLQQAKNVRILVLDSCRDNPLAEELKRSIGATRAVPLQRGLAKIDSPQGMIIAYATQAGRTADDGGGRNSPYTAAFLRHIEAQEEIGTVFRRISADVYEATKRTQLPELSLSLIGEFYLRGRLQITVPAMPPTADPCASAGDHWKSAEAIGTIAAFEDHLTRFANCAFAGLAKARIEDLKNKIAAVAPPAMPPSSIQSAAVPPPVIPDSPCGGRSLVSVSLSSRTAKSLSQAEECALKPKDSFKECDKCPVMVVVPAGSFVMGSPASEKDRNLDEGPQHHVTFARSFAVGRFAVTFDEWNACVADRGCNGNNVDRGRRPVTTVSWEDSKAYVTWLSAKTGRMYRLLSEAEREYVARAGTVTPFWWGSSISASQANYNGKETYGGGSKGEFRGKALPVDSFQPNPWGLYQVHGNVWDWTEDCYHDSYEGAPADGSAWTSGDCSRRALRGGSFNDDPADLRAAYRLYGRSDQSGGDYRGGFRIARTLNQ
jgi:formylglycine-generating enzyme required for sulfatase activity